MPLVQTWDEALSTTLYKKINSYDFRFKKHSFFKNLKQIYDRKILFKK